MHPQKLTRTRQAIRTLTVIQIVEVVGGQASDLGGNGLPPG